MNILTRTHTHQHTPAHALTHARTHTHAHTRTHAHTHTHTHTHTYTHARTLTHTLILTHAHTCMIKYYKLPKTKRTRKLVKTVDSNTLNRELQNETLIHHPFLTISEIL